MKFSSLLSSIILLLGMGTQLSQAQGITGRAYYKSSSQFKISMDSTQMPPEQMAEIQAQLKKQMEKDYILSFTQTESNWKQAESLGGGPATASSGGMTMVINTGSQDRLLYKNLSLIHI